MNKLYLTIIEMLEQSGSNNLLELTTDMIDASLSFYERHQDTARTIILSQHSEAFLIVNEKLMLELLKPLLPTLDVMINPNVRIQSNEE